MAITINYAQNVGLMKKPPVIEIGDKTYTLIKLGDYEIMHENVKDFGVSGYGMDSDYNDYNGVSYYNTDRIQSVFATQISQGFVIATVSIYQSIFNSLTGTDNEKSLSMMSNYSTSWPGNNNTGLDLSPLGYRLIYQNYTPDYLGSRLYIGDGSSEAYISYNGTKLVFGSSGSPGYKRAYPVRLCRHV